MNSTVDPNGSNLTKDRLTKISPTLTKIPPPMLPKTSNENKKKFLREILTFCEFFVIFFFYKKCGQKSRFAIFSAL